MKLSDQKEEIKETFAAWQGFRKLGYNAKDLYVGLNEGIIFIKVDIKIKEYILAIIRTNLSEKEFEEIWLEFCNNLNSISDQEIHENFLNSKFFKRKIEIFNSLANKEIYWPKHEKYPFKNLN